MSFEAELDAKDVHCQHERVLVPDRLRPMLLGGPGRSSYQGGACWHAGPTHPLAEGVLSARELEDGREVSAGMC